MTNQDWINYALQFGLPIIGFIFVLGKYKVMFEHHEKILDKHEESIDKLITRLDNMGNDVNFIKGCMFGKQL